MSATSEELAPAQPPKHSLLVKAYVFFAWATGVMIVLLVFVTIPLRYWGSVPGPEKVIGLVHGVFLYPPYVILSIATAFIYRLSIKHMALMALAGLIPGLSPYVARQTVRHIDEKQAAKAAREAMKKKRPNQPRPARSPVA
jgi:integral membrane protein